MNPSLFPAKTFSFSTTLCRGTCGLPHSKAWLARPGLGHAGQHICPSDGEEADWGSGGVEARPDNQPHGKCFQHFRVHPPNSPKVCFLPQSASDLLSQKNAGKVQHLNEIDLRKAVLIYPGPGAASSGRVSIVAILMGVRCVVHNFICASSLRP